MPKEAALINVLELPLGKFKRLISKLTIKDLVLVATEGLKIYDTLNEKDGENLAGASHEAGISLIDFLHSREPACREPDEFSLESIDDLRKKQIIEQMLYLAWAYYGQPVRDDVHDEKIDRFRKILELLHEAEIILTGLRPSRLAWLPTALDRIFSRRHLVWGQPVWQLPSVFSFSLAGLSPAAEKCGTLSIRGRTAVALLGIEVYCAEKALNEKEQAGKIISDIWSDLAGKLFCNPWEEPGYFVSELNFKDKILKTMICCALDIIDAQYNATFSHATERESQLSVKLILYLLQKNGIFLRDIDKALRLSPAYRLYPYELLGKVLAQTSDMIWGRPITRAQIAPLIEFQIEGD